ncbi:MAG: aminotransferase class I/II-fold pyridoxal phosphate-dependent enzyme [Cyclobacteriaceae bacterium]|nr:aminotransferase class I/II-fold pyridoxal phosphate-dependent enzyme [Cyclobacteriaceae bacterium]
MYRIPLSATPFDAPGISGILDSYSEKPATKLIEDFEAALRAYTGARYVLAVNSGTSAIHLGLMALGVGSGDVVIAPSFTYVATVAPILYQGATPILVDSELTTWNMNPELLETAIKSQIQLKKKPKCAIIVHNYGMPAQMSAINAICDRYEIPILEDAAEALGSQYLGKPAGTLGKIGIFSFNNNKIVTGYGGGALLTESEEIYQKSLFWSTQSREQKPYYEHRELGYNYRISPLSSASGLLGLKQIEAKIEERRAIFDSYRNSLHADKISGWLKEQNESLSNRWLSTFLLSNSLKTSDIVDKTSRLGIECRRLWNPMHLQPFYHKFPAFVSGAGEQLFKEGLSLPSSNLALVSEVTKVLNQTS